MNLFTNLPPQNSSPAVKAAHIAKYKAAKKAEADQPTEEPANEEPVEIDVEAVRRRAAELLASSEPVEKLNPWEQYCKIKKKDPIAAGEYWRKNKAAIKACYHH